MNFIQLDPASLAIGYVCGTLLCYYIMEMFHAKESEYDNESKKGNFYPGSSVYHGNYPYNLDKHD